MSKLQKDEQIELSFANDSDDEDEDNDMIDIKLSSATFQINSIKLYKYSLLFRDKYITKESRNELSQDILRFQQENHINEDNVLLFLQLIQKGNIHITNDNYCDLRKLAKYFQVKKLNKLLNNYSENYLSDVDSIVFQFLEQKKELSEFNQYSIDNEIIDKLSQQVNECLQNKFFEKLPIQTIYHVISKSDKNMLSSDLLLDFILKSVEERHLLFHFLSISKLSDTKHDILYENYNHSENPNFFSLHIPLDLNYIKALQEENKSLKLNLQNENNKLISLNQEKSQLQTTKSQLEGENTQLQRRINDLDTENTQIKTENARIKTENAQIKTENTQIKTENTQIKTENTRYQSKIEELNNENTQIKLKNSQLQMELDNLKMQLSHLKITYIEFNTNDPFNGIFSYLKSQLGPYIYQQLGITASSTFSAKVSPYNVINYDENSKHFCSGDVENSWICFDFKNYRIIPTCYVIRAKQRKVTPVNWVIEGSNDNDTWNIIDDKENCLVLRDFAPHNFDITNKEGFKFIRMRMKGKNSGGNTYTLIVHSFEFYGTLISSI